MATAKVNGVRLWCEVSGAGEIPLVLVHGSWACGRDWDLVAARLANAFRVARYDRRGHSGSASPAGTGGIGAHVDDLAALIEHLEIAPAWVVGNSYGASIALRMASARPELLRGVIGHEPPLFGLLADDPALAPLLEEAAERIGAVVEQIAAGDHAGAAEQFVETVALGPGTWAELPPAMRQTLIQNAPTFLDDAGDPENLRFDPAWLGKFSRPVLLTRGDASPPTFGPVVAKLAAAIPRAELFTFDGVGHIPHVTHPEEFAQAIRAFVGRQAE